MCHCEQLHGAQRPSYGKKHHRIKTSILSSDGAQRSRVSKGAGRTRHRALRWAAPFDTTSASPRSTQDAPLNLHANTDEPGLFLSRSGPTKNLVLCLQNGILRLGCAPAQNDTHHMHGGESLMDNSNSRRLPECSNIEMGEKTGLTAHAALITLHWACSLLRQQRTTPGVV